ncbi:gamete antigen 27/25, putative [Plasmodium relictum]|uniref:Gamete antigen 27/25, putative n=1 Tax=Plasmodium relictum TaxID=85471 RepID=A0A1J1GKA7_PLARL|nr:gamete antigen 27/25, putative [Plasmodium relictum]CRG84905.1 gamete antigen 27/25, putative [Plasmodium relictum]
MSDSVKQENIPCIGNPSFEQCKIASYLEFEITVRYLSKLKEESSDEDKKKALNNYDAIAQDIDKFEKDCKLYKVPKEMQYPMAYRISNRLYDYCFDEPLTEQYSLKLKEIFSVEEDTFQKVFLEALKEKDNKYKKKIIDNINLIKEYLKEKGESKGIALSEEKLQNAATRIRGFLNDFFSFSIIPSRTFPVEPDDGSPPL